MIYHPWFCVFLVLASTFFCGNCQQYDFAAEITRQCLVPDPVGLLDCVENKVTLPYLTSWVDCTNSLGQNVKTSADIINYRCKSVWEGKGIIPEVFFIKDCVIEKTGLPAKNVSAEVLGAYKECESAPKTSQQRIKTAPVQQQQLRVSFEYGTPTQQFQATGIRPPQQQFQAPVVQPPQQQFQAPIQQIQTQIIQPQSQQLKSPVTQPQQFQIPVNRPQAQQFQAAISNTPTQQIQIQTPFQQQQAPVSFQPQNAPRQQQAPVSFQPQNVPRQQAPVSFQPQNAQRQQAPVSFQAQNAPRQQQFQIPVPRPIQTQQPPPIQSPIQVSAPRPVQQTQSIPFVQSPQPPMPMQFNQQQIPSTNTQFRPAGNGSQYPSLPPQSQQFFVIYPQAPLPNQQMRVNAPTFTQKTANAGFPTQQQISDSAPQISAVNPNAPYSYSFQISHPLRPTS